MHAFYLINDAIVQRVQLCGDFCVREVSQCCRICISAIGFDDKTYQALVTLELEAGYKFPKDSSLKILTAGLLGEQYIGIEPGGDTNNLANGDRISRTQSATVLEDLINRFIYSKAAEGTESKE